ncbi:MAG: response regulator [Spirochaetales bacterium]|nr:response regulator [Spirochaetales bacterium]
MIKLMIVDDEKPTLRGIKSMIGRKHTGFVLVAEAMDGQEAVRIAADKKPEVIITDICMPNMNGIELMKQVKKILPDTQCIVLSGYDDFQYAREALLLGAQDYLLKPISSKSFYPLLSKLKKQIEDENKVKTELRSVQYERALEKLLFTGEQGLSPIIDEQKKYIIQLLSLEDCSGTSDFNSFMIFLNKAVLGHDGVVHILDRYKLIIMLCDLQNLSLESFNSTLLQEANYYNLELQINSVRNSIHLSEVQSAYKDILGFEKLNFYSKNRSAVHYYSGESSVSLEPSHIDSLLEEKVLDCLKTVDTSGIRMLFKNTFRKLKGYSVKSSDVKLYCYNLLWDIIKKLSDSSIIFESQISELEQDVQKILDCNYLEDINKLIGIFFEKLAEFKADNSDISGRKVVADIKSFILSHYSSNIHLQDAANHVHLNPKYVSDLFKRESGENFSSYLRSVRISNAKKLLESTNLRIYEISDKVGYRTSKHFLKLFKEETGLTPHEYRESKGKRL